MANGKITVVGLGPAGVEYLTSETEALLRSGAPVVLRTARHPAADELDFEGSFDSLYDTARSFEDVYEQIVSELIGRARQGEAVIYAVPGSPFVAERTVELLRVHPDVVSGNIQLDVRPAMAFTDMCWSALGIDPMAEAVTIVDALALSSQGAGRSGPLLVTQVHSGDVLEDVISVFDDAAPETVTVLQGLGTADEIVRKTSWSELRDAVEPDHLTSLWIPRLAKPLGAVFVSLDEAVRELRAGAPSVHQQAFAEVRALLPAAAEAVTSALDGVLDGEDDAPFDLEDALADLLFQLVSQSRLAAEAGYFTISDLAQTAIDRQQR